MLIGAKVPSAHNMLQIITYTTSNYAVDIYYSNSTQVR